MGWTMLFLFVALKLPLLALCWLVWWAIHAVPEDEQQPGPDGGARVRPHPPRPLPRPPRRGPHGEQQLPAPPRVRQASAHALERRSADR